MMDGGPNKTGNARPNSNAPGSLPGYTSLAELILLSSQFSERSQMEIFMDGGGGWLSRLFGGQRAENAQKVENPTTAFDKPSDVVNDNKLSYEEKKEALNTWEQDARQLMTASNEGMPGPKEGLNPADHHQMGQVVRAKEEIGEKPKNKLAH